MILAGTSLAGDFDGHYPATNSPEQVRLAAAIKSGDLAAVQATAQPAALQSGRALQNYALHHGTGDIVRFLNRKAHLGVSELQMAVLDNDVEHAKFYAVELPQRPPIVLRNDEHSPLRLAVRHGHVEMVKMLLERNAPVNERIASFFPERKPSILVDAIHLGNPEIVRLLVDAGTKLEEPEFRLLPKPGATYQGKPVGELWGSFDFRILFYPGQDYKQLEAEKESLQKELLAKGLLVREPVLKPNANAPLALAIAGGREKIVAVLLDAGASPNVNVGGETRPLHLAVQKGHPGIVRLLLKAGADVNQSDAEGRTPLGLASSHGDIADMLRAAGAKAPPMFREDEIPAPRIKEIELEPAPDDFGGREMARAN